MISKEIIFFGKKVTVQCDEKCDKAWGLNTRPYRTNNTENREYLLDEELDIAPKNPGTFEGGIGKPIRKEERLNKWCVRECERITIKKGN